MNGSAALHPNQGHAADAPLVWDPWEARKQTHAFTDRHTLRCISEAGMYSTTK